MNKQTESNGYTIFALSTPPGRGGIAVVRVSGPQAFDSVNILTNNTVFSNLDDSQNPTPQIKLCKITHPVSRETIDRGLVLCFRSPRSFTGEDTVEYHLHGGRAVTETLLDALSGMPGHRLAEPGEFTRRAFENGKMDLTAAEAVADLIDAETQAQKDQALAQMGGALSSLYDGWRGRLSRTLAHLEADIDFPEEDLPGGVAAAVRPEIATLATEVRAHLDDNRRGERLREGVRVAVIGAPNAGKSSLLNALAQRDVAIVSDTPGTTRDVIELHLDLGGYPVIVADTAGLRDSADHIETEGVRRARAQAKDADLRILLFDSQAGNPDPETMAFAGENSLIVWNKSDLQPRYEGLCISALTGAGLDTLMEELIRRIEEIVGDRTKSSPTRARHREALGLCYQSLIRAEQGSEAELIAEDVRLAVRALGRITGRVDVEDLLDVIFRDFCIGK